jgi:hypothetical protein
MATKEDILEQIVEEYLSHKGYFVRHNIKFLPDKSHPDFLSRADSNHSDIDVLGFHPSKDGPDRVVAVSCKSWQGGFNPSRWLSAIKNGKVVNGRPAWKTFRELVNPKWADAFRAAVLAATGSKQFTYIVAVAHLHGDKSEWETNKEFSNALGGNPIRIVTFHQMIHEINLELKTTLAATEVGRMLQMFRAAGFKLGELTSA